MLSLTVLERGRIERDKDLAPNAPREQFGTPERLRLPAVLFDRLWNAEGVRVDRGEKPIFTLGRHRATVGPAYSRFQAYNLSFFRRLRKLRKSPLLAAPTTRLRYGSDGRIFCICSSYPV